MQQGYRVSAVFRFLQPIIENFVCSACFFLFTNCFWHDILLTPDAAVGWIPLPSVVREVFPQMLAIPISILIRRIETEYGVKPAQICNETGVSPKLLGNIKRGASLPTEDFLRRLFKVYNISQDEYSKWVEEFEAVRQRGETDFPPPPVKIPRRPQTRAWKAIRSLSARLGKSLDEISADLYISTTFLMNLCAGNGTEANTIRWANKIAEVYKLNEKEAQELRNDMAYSLKTKQVDFSQLPIAYRGVLWELLDRAPILSPEDIDAIESILRRAQRKQNDVK